MPAARSEGLADLLRDRTRSLHTEAERTGVVAALLRGRASRRGYALLLRNLLPVYRSLESGLSRLADRPGLDGIARPPVYRASRLESDLEALCGPQWAGRLPLLPAGDRYAGRVAEAGEDDGQRLLAHAYARYLGDLNGGRMLRRMLADSLGIGAEALAFYEYPEIPDLDAFKRSYREAIDAAAGLVDAEAVAAEACDAFRLNIELSREVQRRCAEAPPG